MTQESKGRKFWIEKFNGRSIPSWYVHTVNPGHCTIKISKDLVLMDASEYFHVIEMSAYRELEAQLEKAKEALRFECGNRCSDLNPCNAKETLKELGE